MKKVDLKGAGAKNAVRHFDFRGVQKPLKYEENEGGITLVFQLGELRVHAFMSAKAGKSGRFVPRSIEKNGEFIWHFSTNEKEEGVNKIAFLLTHEAGFHLIAVISGNLVLKVIPLDDLEKGYMIKTTDGPQLVGGRELLQLVQLKGSVADSLGFVRELSQNEALLLQVRSEIEMKRTKETVNKGAEKERRRQEILSRNKIFAYRENGQKIKGIPVIEGEWQCLPDGTGVILVAEYDGKAARNWQQAFYVEKKGSSCGKRNCCPVTEMPILPKEEVIVMKKQLFFLDDEINEFFTVTGDELEKLRKKGVNSGSKFAVSYDGKPPVLIKLTGNEVVTLGNLRAL
jgi:hypothetical protein